MKTRHSEAGPEAVLPLRSGAGLGLNLTINFGAGSITLGGAADVSNPKAMFREFAETIAYEVQQVLV